jgi:hypothetical protein
MLCVIECGYQALWTELKHTQNEQTTTGSCDPERRGNVASEVDVHHLDELEEQTATTHNPNIPNVGSVV